MAAPHTNTPVTPDTLITIKISVNDQLKKLKLPLRDLGAAVLPDKVCEPTLTRDTQGWSCLEATKHHKEQIDTY